MVLINILNPIKFWNKLYRMKVRFYIEKTAFATWKARASLSEDPGIAEFREMFKKLSSRIYKR